jgi:hypothetical protein
MSSPSLGRNAKAGGKSLHALTHGGEGMRHGLSQSWIKRHSAQLLLPKVKIAARQRLKFFVIAHAMQ